MFFHGAAIWIYLSLISIFVRTYLDYVKNICHLELANHLTKCTLLVIGRSIMCLILQEQEFKSKY